MENERLALTAMYAAGLCGVLGMVLPWFVLLVHRSAAVAVATALTLAGTVAFLISTTCMPGRYNIRVDLVLLPPLLLVAWLECIALGIWSRRRKTAKPKFESGWPNES